MMTFLPSSTYSSSHHICIKKNRNLAFPAISCERLRALSLGAKHKKSALQKHSPVFPRPQKGREEEDKTRLLIRNHHPPLRQNLMRIRQIRQFFLFGFRPIIHRRSIIDCRSRTILTILTMMMMMIDTIQRRHRHHSHCHGHHIRIIHIRI